MITEFEQRLAEVLGARLPAPFGGRVSVGPGPGPGPEPTIVLGAHRTEVVEPDLGSRRPEIAPGSSQDRRVVRARCTVALAIRPATEQGRAQQMQGLDAALYALDAPDLRNGSALRAPGDPGFLITELRVLESTAPLDPNATGAPPIGLTLRAEGWFWPVGVVGETGIEIGELRIRGVVLPLSIEPARPRLLVGGEAVELTLRVRNAGSLRLRPEDAETLAFGRLALALLGPGGRPGAGALGGGTAGEEGVRLATLTEGAAVVTYTPPDEAVTDTLLVALENGEEGLGLAIGRFPLEVREG